MPPRFLKGQRVKVVPVRNPDMTPKYPEIESYTSETGVVVEDYFVRYKGTPGPQLTSYMYLVRLDAGHRAVPIAEDALEACLD